jgi:hypothetical protein
MPNQTNPPRHKQQQKSVPRRLRGSKKLKLMLWLLLWAFLYSQRADLLQVLMLERSNGL